MTKATNCPAGDQPKEADPEEPVAPEIETALVGLAIEQLTRGQGGASSDRILKAGLKRS